MVLGEKMPSQAKWNLQLRVFCKLWIGLCLGLFAVLPAWAQFGSHAMGAGGTVAGSGTGKSLHPEDTATVVVRHILISGNKITKPYIILRELPFSEGDRIPVSKLPDLLEQAHNQLMNTFLFIDVVPGIKQWQDGALDIVLDCKERWYIFPIPYLKIIDRNFNQWWVEENHSFQRIDYGVHFSWFNITGRNDKLHIYAQTGYNRLLNVGYETPYLDRKLRQFLSISALYNNAKQVNYATDSNKQVFFPDTTHLGDVFIHRMVQGSVAYIYRIGVTQRHTVRLTYTDEQLADTINILAQKLGYAPFFNGGVTHIRYPELSYVYQYQGVDYIPYPLHGVAASAMLDVKGLGLSKDINFWSLTLNAGYYRPLLPKTFLALEGTVVAKSQSTPEPYVTSHLMGFGNMFLQGLEYYIVDGSFGALGRVTLRQMLVNHDYRTIFKNSRNYGVLPIRVFLKTYFNAGYAAMTGLQYGSTLNNRFLYTEGIGLDIVTIYDLQLKVEFSLNQLGQNGLFLHNYKGF